MGITSFCRSLPVVGGQTVRTSEGKWTSEVRDGGGKGVWHRGGCRTATFENSDGALTLSRVTGRGEGLPHSALFRTRIGGKDVRLLDQSHAETGSVVPKKEDRGEMTLGEWIIRQVRGDDPRPKPRAIAVQEQGDGVVDAGDIITIGGEEYILVEQTDGTAKLMASSPDRFSLGDGAHVRKNALGKWEAADPSVHRNRAAAAILNQLQERYTNTLKAASARQIPEIFLRKMR